jgi:hypothetical protein
MGFFTSKSETLLQSFADTLVKGVINGLLIMGVALVVTAHVKRSMEISNQKAALRNFNNDYLIASADFLIKSYAGLACTRDPLLIANPECKTGLGKFITGIDERKNFLAALFPNSDFVALDGTRATLDELSNMSRDTTAEAIDPAIRRLSELLPQAVNQITRKIE